MSHRFIDCLAQNSEEVDIKTAVRNKGYHKIFSVELSRPRSKKEE